MQQVLNQGQYMAVDVCVLSIMCFGPHGHGISKNFSINLLLLLVFETGFQVAQASLKLHT